MPRKLGILAGGGPLPVRLIQSCRASGRQFLVAAFEGQTDPETVDDVPHVWVRLGAAGSLIDRLREAGVEDLVFAGRIRRPSLTALRPDARAVALLARAGGRTLGDDGTLSAIIQELEEREGFRVIGPEALLPDDLAPPGVYGAVEPDAAALGDIERGIAAARGIGALDIGQAAVVQQGLVLAVEAIEGTDAMLARCGELRREGPGGVLVKVKKPSQEARADLPTIGVGTVDAAAAAGLRGIAIEAHGALVIDRSAVARAADAEGIFVIGVSVGGTGDTGDGKG